MINNYNNLYIKQVNEQKGYGVYSKNTINKGNIIEKALLINTGAPSIVEKKNKKGKYTSYIYNHPNLVNYTFKYPRNGTRSDIVLATGFGSFYNHDEDPNASWRDADTSYVFEFYALRDIQPNQEICIYYGRDWWSNKKRLDGIFKNRECL